MMRPLTEFEQFWVVVIVVLLAAIIILLAFNYDFADAEEYTGTQYILDSHNLYIEDHDYHEQLNRQRELDTNWNLQQQINDIERDSNYDPHPDPAPIRPAPVQNFRIVD